VFGGVFDAEFRESSIQLFEQVKRGEVVCLYSDMVDDELVNAPKNVRDFVKSIDAICFENISVNISVVRLAMKYMSEKVIGIDSFEDCLHVAFATIYAADILVSWDFKHIVNSNRIAGYNSVNFKMSFKSIEIQSPKQIYNNEKGRHKK